MHGNRKISEYAPDGRTSETVFAVPGFSAGIQQGVVISLWVKSGKKPANNLRVLYRDDLTAARAQERRAQLLASLSDPHFTEHYGSATPNETNRYSFRPSRTSSDYLSWPRLVDLCGETPSNGLMEKRGGALIDIDRAALVRRMNLYYDPATDWDTLEQLRTGFTEEAAGFNPKLVRSKVMAAEKFNPLQVRRYALRPFDTHWCYYSAVSPLWNRSRPNLWAQAWDGNSFVLTRFRRAKSPEGPPFSFTQLLSDDHYLSPDAVAIPIRVRPEMRKQGAGQLALMGDRGIITANLSPAARAYLGAFTLPSADADSETAALLWMHALAMGFAPEYLRENDDGIAQDWPRVPLPNSPELLKASAALGTRLAALLDTERPVIGVTAGAIRPELKSVGVVEGTMPLNLSMTAGWGSAGRDGVTMPGKGKRVTRAPRPEECVVGLGETTHDVYLNEDTYWRNVPDRVWEYRIGGYQVIKKWLSYREADLLGRPITQDEAREVRDMARRIAAIILLEPALDANYAAVKAATYAWPGK
jgi:hypothetical protein